MSNVLFKLETPHRDECWTDGDDMRFIVVARGEAAWDWHRRRDGRKGGSALYWRFLCNDPNCPATALVRWDALARFVTQGVAQPDNPRESGESK